MNSSRFALSLSSLAFVASCGGLQPAISAPGAMPQSYGIAQQGAHGKSWMLPEARGEDLIYTSGECGGTCILSYPQGKPVGSFSIGGGLCSDAQGNVFLTHNDTVYKYAHGGTSPIATLPVPGDEATGCGVDPTTNNLAVVFNGYAIAIFTNASGSPAVYSSGISAEYCGYDNAGDLFISGYANGPGGGISELPRGQQSPIILSINGKLGDPGQIQWDGSEMTYQNKTNGSPISIAQLSISGSTAIVVGTTTLRGHMNYGGPSWIYKNTVLVAYGKKIHNMNKIGIWPYPKGGSAKTIIKYPRAYDRSFETVTISVVPSH